ncbi:MAG: hypothetical protein LBQ74_11255 [Prevotella sp.]|jgi:hypothetical protein|nr:hypothetical protein [Prevotella sp.]
MENQNQGLLDDFTRYIENLCKKHILIKHSAEKKHFVRLDSDEFFQGESADICYPLVAMDKLASTYTDQEDNFRKRRHVELMFLDHIEDIGDFDNIESVWATMESIAEDFLKKIRADRKNRVDYPFLRSLVISNVELYYVENIHTHLWGVLLSFETDLPFNNCLDPGRFGS